MGRRKVVLPGLFDMGRRKVSWTLPHGEGEGNYTWILTHGKRKLVFYLDSSTWGEER